MKNGVNELQPIFSHAEPVLPVENISETISYWRDVLGFPNQWTWGDPPSHGSVSWHGAFIQFSHNPELATASKGNSVWIRVRRVELLYHLHKGKNADIVVPLENQPWGMAQYTVKEINGYYIHFAGVITDRKKNVETLSSNVRIIERAPFISEYRNLALSVGWSPSPNDDVIRAILNAAIFAVVAEDIVKGEVVGCALLLGDHESFYYVKDLMVRPDWQGKQVGTALMATLNNWLEKNGANNALVALITGEALESFYQKFGFVHAFSMIRYIQHDNK